MILISGALTVTLSILFKQIFFVLASEEPHGDHEVPIDHHEGNGSDTEHEQQHENSHHPPYVVLFIFGCCVIGAITRTLLKKVPIPYTVVLLVAGFLLGILSFYSDVAASYTHSAAHMDPHVLLHVFLPVLLFESAFAMDVHTFMKSFVQVMILAILGLMVATVLTAVLAMYVFSYNWSFNISMMFGAIMSATDPVAVVALLKDLGASKQLGTLIEGESLLNDGCSIVVFDVFNKMASPHHDKTAADVVLQFMQVALGGTAWGIVVGKITTVWLSHIFNDAMVEITITLASTYLTFYIGESVMKVSGVLAVVVLGLFVNAERTSISPEVEVFLHRFWEMLAYLANTLIFMIVGVVIAERAMDNVESMDWFYLVALYIGINIIRAIAIATFSPILARIGYGLTWRNAVVMTWGGLRGAVGLALALLVAQSGELDEKMIGSKILFHTSGIVVLTLVLNATTIQFLLKQLGMSDISTPKRLAMTNAVRQVQEAQSRTFAMLKADRFLADADFTIAEAACTITDPYRTLEEQDEEGQEMSLLGGRTTTCPACQTGVPQEPSPQEFHEMMDEARLRMLKAEKTSYWKQFEHGMLSRDATRVLVQSTEQAADEATGLVNIENLAKTWKIKGFYPFLKRKLEDLISDKKRSVIPEPNNVVQLLMYRISIHVLFELFIMVVIVLNMVPIIMAFLYQEGDPMYPRFKPFFTYSNYIFTGIFVLEAFIKIGGLRKHYFFSHWNQFDIFIIVLSLADIILDTTIGDTGGFSPQMLKVVKLFRLLRGLRMLRLFKIVIPRMIGFVDGRINRQLSLGYDVGKGFVLGEEEVVKLIDKLVDDPKILVELKRYSENSRLNTIRQLGMLQRVHPGIAVSVKTRQAIRTVLNISRDTVKDLQGAGLLDEMEVHKLEKEVEVRMKRLMNAPSSIPPPPPEALLKNVAWLSNDKKLINFIKSKAELLHFDYGDVIMSVGDVSNGIYLIVSGLVKLHGRSEVLDHEVEGTSGPVSMGKSKKSVFEDYLSAGNVIGEMALLTGKPRNCSAICETAVQAYYVNLEDMNLAMDMFTLQPSLEYQLWRVVGIRIATPLLLAQLYYQGWTQSTVKIHLETGFIQDLQEVNYDFEVTDNIEDVILIMGVAINYHTRVEMKAPYVIPRNVRRFLLQPDDNQEPKLFVVPSKNSVAYDAATGHNSNQSVMSLSIRPSTLIPAAGGSRMCLKHAASGRLRSVPELDTVQVNKLPPITNNKDETVADVSFTKEGLAEVVSSC